MEDKKWQATYIAPLRPPTLATFRSWGSSAGAGRIRPAGANIGKKDGGMVKGFKKFMDNCFPEYDDNDFVLWATIYLVMELHSGQRKIPPVFY